MGLDKGWNPGAKGGGAVNLWEAERRFRVADPADPQEVRLAEFALEVVGDLRFDVSVDVGWRRRLFRSPPGERFDVPYENEYGLHFAAFFDGWTSDRMWVIGIECVEFPHAVVYTTNGGAFL